MFIVFFLSALEDEVIILIFCFYFRRGIDINKAEYLKRGKKKLTCNAVQSLDTKLFK